MGRRLAELLLARLAGREQIGQEILPTHLVVRDSS
jgi:DNA-binding LacI/PurR family transcriptional regulator